MASEMQLTNRSKTTNNETRSLQYYQESNQNATAWFGIMEADYSKLLEVMNWDLVFGKTSSPFQLLDIGCGTGKFPRMLRPQLRRDVKIIYDYLDPSPYSLTTCQQALHPPFEPRYALQTTFEEAQLDSPPNGYDMVWAIQSLYWLPHKFLNHAATTIHRILNPDRGTAMVIFGKTRLVFSPTP